MKYTFECKCGVLETLNLPVEECDSHPTCKKCGKEMTRNFVADLMTVQVNTNGCKDHNKVKAEKRVAPGGMVFTPAQAERREELFRKDIALKKEAVARGGNKGLIKMKKSVPADLYHGKIKESGDKDYWNDKKNLNRHKDFDL
jgi:hypothetical protein